MKYFLVLLFTLACAKPEYVDSNLSLKKVDSFSAECSLFFESEQTCFSLKWIKYPTESDAGSFELRAHSKNDPRLIIQLKNDLLIDLWMPSHGHGSSPVTITKLNDGTYIVSDIYFIMPGLWQIRFSLNQNGNNLETHSHFLQL